MKTELTPQQLEDSGRNPNGTFKEGHEKIPGSGRPKNTIKDYLRHKFNSMTDEEKEEFLKDIPKELQFRMAEGNPHNTTDLTSNGEPIPILGKTSVNGTIQDNNGNKEDLPVNKEN